MPTLKWQGLALQRQRGPLYHYIALWLYLTQSDTVDKGSVTNWQVAWLGVQLSAIKEAVLLQTLMGKYNSWIAQNNARCKDVGILT